MAVWKEAFGKRWVGVTVLVFALVSNADTVLGWLGVQSRFGVVVLSAKLSPKTWIILGLTLTIGVLLESVYRVAVERDTARSQLKTERRNQDLSDKMSDHHEHAVHELLNKPPKTPADLDAWKVRVKDWEDSVYKVMRSHGCSKQEKRHVQTLGLINVMPLSSDPAIAHALSMLVTRMGRIADIAGKYGE